MAETLDALPELRKLNVNGCIGLTRLRLPHCTKLHWLDCSGCALLQHLHAFSPALSHVRAVACQRLMVGCCCCCAGHVMSGNGCVLWVCLQTHAGWCWFCVAVDFVVLSNVVSLVATLEWCHRICVMCMIAKP